MAKFCDRLNEAMKMKDVTAADLSRMTGISEGSLSQYRRGTFEAAQTNLDRLATALDVSIPWLMGLTDKFGTRYGYLGLEPLPRTKKLPLLGSIPCGTPALAVEDDELVDVPDGIKADFCLRARGDSMVNARIFDGDLVFIRQQDDVESGEIAAVMLNDEATLKRVVKQNGMVILMPENPAVAPVFVPAGQPVRILGKAVGFMSARVL